MVSVPCRTTNPSKLVWEAMGLLEARANPAIHASYRAVGSGTGQFEFMGADQGYAAFNDFGSGDMPFSTEDRQTLLDNGVTVLHVPFNLGAMSFFHNVPDSTLPDSGLFLDACTIADIFKAVITTWDHDDIMALGFMGGNAYASTALVAKAMGKARAAPATNLRETILYSIGLCSVFSILVFHTVLYSLFQAGVPRHRVVCAFRG